MVAETGQCGNEIEPGIVIVTSVIHSFKGQDIARTPDLLTNTQEKPKYGPRSVNSAIEGVTYYLTAGHDTFLNQE